MNDFAGILHDIIFDYTLRNVALGSALLGIVSGVLGTFAVLRRQGLLGDTLAHAALPGVCVAFLLTESKDPAVLLAGAAVAGLIGSVIMQVVVGQSRLSEDTALGVVLSVFFGVGILLLTYISKQNVANQAGLDRFLFGQAATLIESNVRTLGIVGGVAMVLVAAFYKEFKLLTFDSAYAASLGFNTPLLSVMLTSLIVVAVVIGLQTVGVVLMAAMLIGPAAAARQWTDRLGVMIGLSAAFGALSGVLGAVLSFTQERLPTGPMIILSMTCVVAVSLAFAPARGMVWQAWRRRRYRAHLVASIPTVHPEGGRS